ncbi:M4 family metallopeptidase [Paracrocinitomix mangrovi]|uniref:M4 family metallopeptidase n=1 Tax=Paracrocinitomix mangrovi TaxID=2862509 RepID=UPI001C8E8F6A|nr:M4 family metallopeptidase [Paracrocinitomix mangrovi]UKN01520.1 M4 family metallopeptidase [Paracrocinitomix mangrovi]
MKLNLIRLTTSFVLIGALHIATAQEIFNGSKAEAIYSDAAVVRTHPHSNIPSYVKFKQNKEIDIDGFQIWCKKNFRLSENFGFELIKVESDKLGHQHYRYQQTYNGYPIEFANWIVHTKSGKVYSMNGLLYNSINPSINASLSKSSALNKALNHVDAETYKWELQVEEDHLKRESHDPTATYFPKGELVVVSKGANYEASSYKLAYKFNIYAHKPVSRSFIYVDANTGEILLENEVFHHIDAVGTAQTAYSGTQTITADSFSGSFRLRETGRGNGVNTYDMNTGTNYGNAVDFTDADNNWNNVNADLDQYATDAHWGAEMTYDYFWLIHNRNSIDGNGFELNSYVHYDVDYANAFWDGTRMTYGDGNTNWNPLTSIDIAGHEITHGLTSFTADLVYQSESGALNESFSDIFGTAIEHYAMPSNFDWLMGEDIGSALRSLSNPNAFGDPDTYFGTNWASLTGGDNGGVHTNSGVQNFWYYLLVNGGTGTNDNSDTYNVAGLGWDDASDIAFRNLTVYLTSSSDYAEARFYAIQSAIDLFGGCSPQVESCTNAWYAVGVGPEYVMGVVSDMNAPITSACSAPFTVNFNNTSINGTTFEWDFGDGNTSTGLSPSHTYNALGTYTVTLIADGGACGSDTTVWVNYIDIDNNNPCEIIMPTQGTANTQSACAGTIYDSGGSTGNYGPNEDAQITISPVGASTVDINFTFFDVEAGQSGSCNYDYVRVYDGPSTASPLIDTYCNNNIPGSISSTGGDITIVFHSDPGVEDAGYIITWNCVLPTSPPVADYSINVDTTCNGSVVFTDLSTNGPNAWSWDFGDGNTSTDQNPSHDYTASGTYTVTLTATNNNGSDIITYSNVVYVNLPVAPSTVGDNICENNIATLTATANNGGSLEWYDAQTGGNQIGTSSPFTTPSLSNTTSYWVEETIPGASQNLGPADNTFGGGGFFNGNQHLVFDVTSPVTLKTVKVYANGSGDRNIELRNSAGTVVQSATVFIPNGEQVITLDFDLTVGTDWQLGTQANSNQDLYRNNTGPSFPYNVGGGEVTITQSSPGLDYYYFFYDWVIESPSCTSERTEVIATVTPQSDATITPVAPMCSGDGIVTLSAVDAGGTWSGTGVSGNQFDPSVAGNGSHTITYTIAGTCGDNDQITIDVADSYDATIASVSDMCTADGTTILTAVDGGGVWSGTGITNSSTGEFDPLVAGAGSHTITYDISGTCGDNDQIVINVNTSADATITGNTNMCLGDTPVDLVAADGGGVWSGTGITNSSTGTFDPAAAGIGNHTINYDISGTCGDNDQITITVQDVMDATINNVTSMCTGDNSITLTAVDAGGLWSGTGITNINDGTFNPATAGVGTHEIIYTISGNCGDADTIDIVVEETPDASITPAGPFCRYEETQQLSAITAGGTWSADCGSCINSTTGEFDPVAAGTGAWTVTYSIGGNCPASATMVIEVGDCLGFEELDNNILVYPNPTSGSFNIDLGIDRNTNVQITDLSGRLVYQKWFNQQILPINLDNEVADGPYLLQIQDSEGITIKTIKILLIR